MRSTIIRDKQFNFSLQTIKLCKTLMSQREYALSNQLIDDVTLIQDCIDKPKLKQADLTQKLAKLSVHLDHTRTKLEGKGEFKTYLEEARNLLEFCRLNAEC